MNDVTSSNIVQDKDSSHVPLESVVKYVDHGRMTLALFVDPFPFQDCAGVLPWFLVRSSSLTVVKCLPLRQLWNGCGG